MEFSYKFRVCFILFLCLILVYGRSLTEWLELFECFVAVGLTKKMPVFYGFRNVDLVFRKIRISELSDLNIVNTITHFLQGGFYYYTVI
jgi:hypothetical protein